MEIFKTILEQILKSDKVKVVFPQVNIEMFEFEAINALEEIKILADNDQDNSFIVYQIKKYWTIFIVLSNCYLILNLHY